MGFWGLVVIVVVFVLLIECEIDKSMKYDDKFWKF